jgi:cytochrome c biogenesis protein ResB
MGKIGRIVMWLVLAVVGTLALLSVAGAFLGAEAAKQFFNSIPLKIYWYILALLFVIGFVEFPRLIRQPPSLLVHAGCLFVLIGAMLGSDTGHQLAKRFFGIDNIPSGYMVIYKGQSENRVVTEDFKHILGRLPFSIKLNNFRIEYYESDKESAPQLNIETRDGKHLQLAAKTGEEISLGQGQDKLKVVRTFTNFKISIEKGQKIVVDEKGTGENPAVEIEITRPDGTTATRYVFERFGGHFQDTDEPQVSYAPRRPRMVRDYFSDVTVIKDGKDIVGKTIEVNHPLHYGGYHFYQHSYDSDAEEYTVLSVASDSGLYAVYSGYWLLSVGVLWQFWLRPVLKAKKRTEV